MPSPLRIILDNLAERLDEDLLRALYTQASLSTAEIRADLDARGLTFIGADPEPLPHELDTTSNRVIRSAARRAAARGALAGAGGLLAVPPEAAASAIQTLRLAQRLAVVWGHDPDTDRGQVHLTRALAHTFGVELPESGPIDLRLRDLPALAVPRLHGVQNRTGDIARVLAVRSAVTLARRFTRWIPGVGAGLGAVGAHRSLTEQGRGLVAYYRRVHTGQASAAPIEDAVEVVAR